MRGAPAVAHFDHLPAGIIPAYAGSTFDSLRGYKAKGDHPRVCGEHVFCSLIISPQKGSSPRMRGALGHPIPTIALNGIIPAYAGSTANRHVTKSTTWDHPRVCGEHLYECIVCTHGVGSSPRMRGARERPAFAGKHERIIPAYAGSTRGRAPRSRPSRDHPRVCGEHSNWHSAEPPVSGSSPRMRGAQTTRAFHPRSRRIIPAYAGSTPGSCRCRWCTEDHPRVCGEHAPPAMRICVTEGSSPRMRGAPLTGSAAKAYTRIIPAYAGSTVTSNDSDSQARDHPRVCGEHLRGIGFPFAQKGSSPRMRGARSAGGR